MRVSESGLEGVRERVGGRGVREGKIEGEKGGSVRVMAEGRVRVRRKESIKVGLERTGSSVAIMKQDSSTLLLRYAPYT